MSGLQKVIKYGAMAFAVFLAVNIIGGLFVGVLTIGNLFDKSDTKVTTKDLEVLETNRGNYRELDIDIVSASLVIKEAETFKIETNNKYVRVREEENTLEIEEKEHLLGNTDSTVVIYVPYNYQFKEVSIDSGAGVVEVLKLNTRDISLDLGAGKVEFNNLVVSGDADIDGGAGTIEINDGVINNLELDMGVGKLMMKAKLTGSNDIDAGVGDSNITLIGKEDDYTIRINKGIGDAIIDDEMVSNNTYRGTGNSKVYIDGGIGRIIVKFTE